MGFARRLGSEAPARLPLASLELADDLFRAVLEDLEQLVGMVVGVFHEMLCARHPVRAADTALHALPKPEKLWRDVASNLLVALAASLRTARTLLLQPRAR